MSLKTSNQQARKLAKDFIKPCVLRGDTVDNLASGMMGVACTHFHIQIGGYAVLTHGKPMGEWESTRLGRYEIAVTEIAGVECLYRFNLKELYDEIREGREQMSLLEGGDGR